MRRTPGWRLRPAAAALVLTTLVLTTLVLTTLVLTTLGACDPCADLEGRLCQDLGAEDCAIWKSPPVNQAGIGSETMTSESCANTHSGPTYDRMLEAARRAVYDRKKALEREEANAK